MVRSYSKLPTTKVIAFVNSATKMPLALISQDTFLLLLEPNTGEELFVISVL